MESFLSSVLISLLLLSIGMFFLPLAFPTLPSFPGELVANFITGLMWSKEQHQGLLLVKLVRFGIEAVIAAIGAAAFLVGGLHGYLTAIHETGYCCLKFRSALKKLSEVGAKKHISNHQRVRKYQEIRILNTLFNSVYEFRFYIVLIGMVQLGGIVGLCITINLSSKVPLPVFGIMAFINVTKLVFILFSLTVGSTVWIESEVLLQVIRAQNARSINKRLSKRLGQTLPPLKVKVGSVNFIEKMTPCVVISFLIQQAISLIVLSK
jgi:hypothetical protein